MGGGLNNPDMAGRLSSGHGTVPRILQINSYQCQHSGQYCFGGTIRRCSAPRNSVSVRRPNSRDGALNVARHIHLLFGAGQNRGQCRLRSHPEAEGVRCWIAPRDILPGADWGESIIDAINGTRRLHLEAGLPLGLCDRGAIYDSQFRPAGAADTPGRNFRLLLDRAVATDIRRAGSAWQVHLA